MRACACVCVGEGGSRRVAVPTVAVSLSPPSPSLGLLVGVNGYVWGVYVCVRVWWRCMWRCLSVFGGVKLSRVSVSDVLQTVGFAGRRAVRLR